MSCRVVVGYGFWLFILSNIVMFSAFFATYAVLKDATAGGPSGADLFSRTNAGIGTARLLLSSYTCGMATIAQRERRRSGFTSAWPSPLRSVTSSMRPD